MPEEIGRFIPRFFYGWSLISVVISALDALQPDDLSEKVEATAHIFSSLVPRIVGGLLVVLFAKEWSVLLFLLVLIANSVSLTCFEKRKLKSKTYSKLSSCFSSVIVPVLMKKKISDKERGIYEELDKKVKVKTQKILGYFSLINISVYLLIISAFVSTIYFSPSFKTNLNNIISSEQMIEIFKFIFLPACGVSIFCSMMMCLIPSAAMEGKFNAVKMIVDIITIITTILIPVYSGIYLISPCLQNEFVFVKV